jgi:hypothetical protein
MNIMADAARDMAIISAKAYLAREEAGETRHEFVNGVVYAMVGATSPITSWRAICLRRFMGICRTAAPLSHRI